MKQILVSVLLVGSCMFAHGGERIRLECAMSIDITSDAVSKAHLMGFLEATYKAIDNPTKYFEDNQVTVQAPFPGVGQTEAFEMRRLVVVLKLSGVPETEDGWRMVISGLKKLVRSGFGEAKFAKDTAVGACAGELKDTAPEDFVQLVNS